MKKQTKQEKKILCDRCKRELDWEQKEIFKNMTKEELLRVVLGFMEREDSLKKTR